MFHEYRTEPFSKFGSALFVLLAPMMVLPALGQSQELEVHGFVSQGYLDSSEHDLWANTRGGTFEFSEIGLNLSKRFNESLRIGIQFFARDLGDLGNHEIEIDWALGEYLWRDELGFRIGKIKQPIGIYNQERDVDLLRSSVLLPQTVYPEGSRNFMLAYEGFEIFGHLPGDIDYELYTGAVQFDENHPAILPLFGLSFPGTPFVNPKLTNDWLVGGALKWNTPIPGLILASAMIDADLVLEVDLLDGTSASSEAEGNRLRTYSISYQRDRLKLSGEWSEFDVTIQGQSSDPAGWYVQAEYQARDQLALHYHYGELYADRNDRKGEAFAAATGLPDYLVWHANHTVGFRLDLGSDWLIKAEWHQMEGLGLILTYDPLSLDNITADEWHVFALKTTFSF